MGRPEPACCLANGRLIVAGKSRAKAMLCCYGIRWIQHQQGIRHPCVTVRVDGASRIRVSQQRVAICHVDFRALGCCPVLEDRRVCRAAPHQEGRFVQLHRSVEVAGVQTGQKLDRVASYTIGVYPNVPAIQPDHVLPDLFPDLMKKSPEPVMHVLTGLRIP